MSRVLIIESESSVAQSLADAFTDRGADTVVTGDGSEALDLARSEQPALIVLCVELSRGSGYSVCNKLKKDSELSSIPLILTSSQATNETFEQHKKLRTRADGYIKKPYDTGDLLRLAAPFVELGDDQDDDEEVEVSLDDVSVEEEGEFEVSIEDEADTSLSELTDGLTDGLDDAPAVGQATPSPGAGDVGGASQSFARPPTQILLSDAEAERMRGEIRQLRQKVQRLEQSLQEQELEFNDRLLEESARARDAVDIKKKLAQAEREIAKYQQIAERAEGEVERLRQELRSSRDDVSQTAGERQVLSEKIGQLVDKVKSLAAERDQLQAEAKNLKNASSEAAVELERAVKVRDKAKKAVDIAMQLIDDTGLAH